MSKVSKRPADDRMTPCVCTMLVGEVEWKAVGGGWRIGSSFP